MISLRSKIAQDVLSHFFLHGGAQMHVNELARRLGHESGNLTRKLLELEEEGLLRSERRGHQKYYSLNPSFALLKEYKQIILKSIGLEHLLREALKNVPGVKEAYLFGSYAADRMDAASDIDLLVVGDHKALALQKAVSEVQRRTDREINVVNLTPAEYERRRRGDPFLRSLQREPRISLV